MEYMYKKTKNQLWISRFFLYSYLTRSSQKRAQSLIKYYLKSELTY